MGGVGPAVVVENQWCLHLMICQMGVALFIDALFLRNVLRRETEVSSELQSIVCLTSTLWMDGERRRTLKTHLTCVCGSREGKGFGERPGLPAAHVHPNQGFNRQEFVHTLWRYRLRWPICHASLHVERSCQFPLCIGPVC
jgi:hypothetical protein